MNKSFIPIIPEESIALFATLFGEKIKFSEITGMNIPDNPDYILLVTPNHAKDEQKEPEST